jgi:hypothetical protein
LSPAGHVATVLVLATDVGNHSELLLAHVNDCSTAVTINDRRRHRKCSETRGAFSGLLRGAVATGPSVGTMPAPTVVGRWWWLILAVLGVVMDFERHIGPVNPPQSRWKSAPTIGTTSPPTNLNRLVGVNWPRIHHHVSVAVELTLGWLPDFIKHVVSPGGRAGKKYMSWWVLPSPRLP